MNRIKCFKKFFGILFFILIVVTVFAGKLVVYDNVDLPEDDLKLVNQTSREAVFRITKFFFGNHWPEDKLITISVESREEIERKENISISKETAGLAFPRKSRIYLIYPFRNIMDYPYNSLYTLIYHEIFHVVVYDYLNGVDIPLMS